MKITTITIWSKEDRAPCTVSFDDRDKAVAYKEQVEKMLETSGNPGDLIVTLDSGELNSTQYYLDCLSEELEVDIPAVSSEDSKAMEPEETMEEFLVGFAVDGRYYAKVSFPKKDVPGVNSPTEEKDAFVNAITEEATSIWYEANIGDIECVGSKLVNIEDQKGDIIWEDGRLYLKEPKEGHEPNVMFEVKIGAQEEADLLRDYIEVEVPWSIHLLWEEPKEDCIAGIFRDLADTDGFKQYKHSFPDGVILRTSCPRHLRTKLMNAMLHFHREHNDCKFMVVNRYVDYDGEGFATCHEMANDNGTRVGHKIYK